MQPRYDRLVHFRNTLHKNQSSLRIIVYCLLFERFLQVIFARKIIRRRGRIYFKPETHFPSKLRLGPGECDQENVQTDLKKTCIKLTHPKIYSSRAIFLTV